MLPNNTELRLAREGNKKENTFVTSQSRSKLKNIELVFKYLDELLEKKENNTPRKSISYKTPNKS